MMVRFHFIPYGFPYYQSIRAFEVPLADESVCVFVYVIHILLQNEKLSNVAEFFRSGSVLCRIE